MNFHPHMIPVGGNANANGTEKQNGSVLHSNYKETKRFRQQRLNVTEDAKIALKSNANDTAQNVKSPDNFRNTRHSIKTKQIKYKRMWNDLSAEQKPTTKPVDNKTDTKELIKSSVNVTFLINDKDINEGNSSRGKNNSEYDVDKLKQIITAINEKTKGNVSNDEEKSFLRPKPQRIGARQATDNSTNFTPSHRKKRRRIIFPSSSAVPIISESPQTVSYSIYNHFQPPENFPQDHITPFLDFGRKIPGTVTRGNVNFVDSLLNEMRNSKPSTDKPISEDEPLLEDMDVTLERKTIEKNHPPDRLHVASTNLANYYRRPTPKPVNITNNFTMCASTLRIRRPLIGNKGLKREINQNSTLCNATVANKTEELKPSGKPEVKKFLKVNRTEPTTFKVTKNEVTEISRPDVTTPLANHFTTKILSTAVITSVSVKSDNAELTAPKPLEEDFKENDSDGAIFTPKNKTPSTVRPSLTLYQRNASKNFRTINRNLQFSKLISQLQPNASDEKRFGINQPKIAGVFNFSDPNIEFLLGSDPTTQSVEPESEPVEELTTNNLFNQKPTVIIVTVNEREQNITLHNTDLYDNSSSTPSIVSYKNIEKDTESWRYHTNIENEARNENSTFTPQIYTIFSKAGLLNFTRIEQTTPTMPPKQIKPVLGKQNGDELGIGYQIGFHIITYVLAGLGIIPLVIGIILIAKMILSQNKKQIFEGSEYSSEYNRNPLEFNGGVTSSPIATKLPRVPHHMTHWEIEKKIPSISLPNNSKWEFPRDKLRLQTILGQGNFGQVWKAEADDISGHEGLTRLVAVKMVKEISSTREKEDLIRELVIMQHLGSHPNVVTLLGCCTEKEPYMLIMEYVMYGKLLSFLRDHRTRSHYFNFSDNGDTLTSRDLTVFAYCVARGMEYLQNKQVIHRDLAARNVLVDHNKLCKIADFGMSRHVGESGQIQEHRQSKGALPIRWMAPESLHYSCYTHKTDVWSFGILMWEIVTLGSMPYASMGARVVMRKVKEGYRLEKPKYCKSQLFNVISKCWYSDPNKRPTFTELKQDLGNLLEDPEQMGNYVDLDSLVEEMNQAVHGSHKEKIII